MELSGSSISFWFTFLPFIFLGHCLEEWFFGFPKWAVRHFGPITTNHFYFLSHVPLMLIVIGAALAIRHFPEIQLFISLGAVVSTVLFTNALFHLGSSILFKEYSPGTVTSALLILPYSLMLYSKLLSASLLSLQGLALTLALGCIRIGSR